MVAMEGLVLLGSRPMGAKLSPLRIGLTCRGCRGHRVSAFGTSTEMSLSSRTSTCPSIPGEENRSLKSLSPLMTIRLPSRPARGAIWTDRVVANGKCINTTGNLSFSTSGQLLATARLNRGVEIWDAIKGECLSPNDCRRSNLQTGIFA